MTRQDSLVARYECGGLDGIDQLSLGWLAGILEGEGCFTYTTGGCPVVMLTMTDEDIIHRAAKIIGGNVRKRPQKGHYKQVFFTNTGGRLAKYLMLKIYPHMGQRRKAKIDSVLKKHEAAQAGVALRKLQRFQKKTQSLT